MHEGGHGAAHASIAEGSHRVTGRPSEERGKGTAGGLRRWGPCTLQVGTEHGAAGRKTERDRTGQDHLEPGKQGLDEACCALPEAVTAAGPVGEAPNPAAVHSPRNEPWMPPRCNGDGGHLYGVAVRAGVSGLGADPLWEDEVVGGCTEPVHSPLSVDSAGPDFVFYQSLSEKKERVAELGEGGEQTVQEGASAPPLQHPAPHAGCGDSGTGDPRSEHKASRPHSCRLFTQPYAVFT